MKDTKSYEIVGTKSNVQHYIDYKQQMIILFSLTFLQMIYIICTLEQMLQDKVFPFFAKFIP